MRIGGPQQCILIPDLGTLRCLKFPRVTIACFLDPLTMRLHIKDGRWFETTTAVRINDKLWYTHKGHWIYHRLAEPDIIEEAEAVSVMLADGNWFEDHPGFGELPDHVKQQLNAHLNSQFAPEDEV